ncbi:hypothetical protein NFJ02_18g30250 [Pycnococcus provasolii]
MSATLTYDMVQRQRTERLPAVTTNELKAGARSGTTPTAGMTSTYNMVRAERCMEKERADKGAPAARFRRLCVASYHYIAVPPGRQHDDALKKTSPQLRRMLGVFRGDLPKVANIKETARAHYQHLLDNSRTGDQ